MNTINLFLKGECLIYGQEDYVNRIKSYLELIAPNLILNVLSFPLLYDQPDKTEFDLSLYDSKLLTLNKNIAILLAFSVKKQNAALTRLELMGFKNIYPYNSLMDNALKKEFWERYFVFKNMDFKDIYSVPETGEETNDTVSIYLAKSVYDKPLNYDLPDFTGYVIPIQAGAALTDKRIAAVVDNTGENISSRNRRYSEMTAFYWMWKNSDADYIGICHYRRQWINLSTIAQKLRSTDIDAVLPLPTLCAVSVYDDYILKHIPRVGNTLLEVLKEFSPEYYEASKKIFADKIFYASNMCILKRSVLNNLCEWMFPMLMEIEKRTGDLDDPYYNRYAGFCAERFITLYFLHNKANYSIAHGEKIFAGG